MGQVMLAARQTLVGQVRSDIWPPNAFGICMARHIQTRITLHHATAEGGRFFKTSFRVRRF